MTYKQKFTAWRKEHNIELHDHLSDVVKTEIGTDFQKGQQVTFTNDNGRRFGPYEIMGFCEPTISGACVYLDKDSYWCPVKPRSIKPYKPKK